MNNMYLQHMNAEEKKTYNAQYYKNNKEYWVEWRKKHENAGNATSGSVKNSYKQSLMSDKRDQDKSLSQYKKGNRMEGVSAKDKTNYERLKKEALSNVLRSTAEQKMAEYLKNRNEIARKNALNRYAAETLTSRNETAARTQASGNGRGTTYKQQSGPIRIDVAPDDTVTYIGRKGSGLTTGTIKTDAVIRYDKDMKKAKEGLAAARRAASNAQGRKTPVASLPKTDAPDYSWINEVAKPALKEKVDALAYAANVAKEQTKKVLKSIWDAL